jgi:TatD DNase family protein
MITYLNKKFRPLRELAATIPEDRLLIETDSPYLVPHPLTRIIHNCGNFLASEGL